MGYWRCIYMIRHLTSAHNQSRKSSGSNTKHVTNRRKAEYNVEISADATNEKLKHGLGHVRNATGFCFVSQSTQHAVDFIFRKQSRDPSRRKDGIDVNKEPIVDNLCVCHQEDDRNALDSTLLEHFAEGLK